MEIDKRKIKTSLLGVRTPLVSKKLVSKESSDEIDSSIVSKPLVSKSLVSKPLVSNPVVSNQNNGGKSIPGSLNSAFLITINLNYVPTNLEVQSSASVFDRALKLLLSSNFTNDSVQNSKWYNTNTFPPFLTNLNEQVNQRRVVNKLEAAIGIEISRKGFLHAHILLDVNHNGKITVNCNFIRKKFHYYLQQVGFIRYTDGLAVPFNVYCNSKYIFSNNQTRDNLLRYISKSDENYNIISNYPSSSFNKFK